MNTYSILIFLSLVVVFSYIFDIFAKKTKIPSVLLLFGTGFGLQFLLKYLGVASFDLSYILPIVGTVGLVLIVLEGALELKFEKENIKLIKKTFGSAFFVLVITSLIITFLFSYVTHLSFQTCLVNAIPLGIISSSIAIPSAADLGKEKKEFIIYDSSFSDILGIIFFNFAILNNTYGVQAILNLGKDTIITLIIAVVISVVFLFLIKRITHHIKFFLILALLILVYSIGKFYHLSALIVVLFLGLFLNNAEIIPISRFKQLFLYEKLQHDLNQFLLLTAESAFIIRTFFFLMFGYTMNMYSLLNMSVLMNGVIILIIIYIVRGLYLKYVAKSDVIPEVFIAPRGLINILLFFSIPQSMRLSDTADGLLLFVILASSVVMTYGLLKNKKDKTPEGKEASTQTTPLVEGSESKG